MGELIFKVVAVFLIVYVLWIVTGGVERGDERRALDEDGLFIDLEGTALDRNATSSGFNFNVTR